MIKSKFLILFLFVFSILLSFGQNNADEILLEFVNKNEISLKNLKKAAQKFNKELESGKISFRELESKSNKYLKSIDNGSKLKKLNLSHTLLGELGYDKMGLSKQQQLLLIKRSEINGLIFQLIIFSRKRESIDYTADINLINLEFDKVFESNSVTNSYREKLNYTVPFYLNGLENKESNCWKDLTYFFERNNLNISIRKINLNPLTFDNAVSQLYYKKVVDFFEETWKPNDYQSSAQLLKKEFSSLPRVDEILKDTELQSNLVSLQIALNYPFYRKSVLKEVEEYILEEESNDTLDYKFFTVHKEASFLGGAKQMNKYLAENIEYPEFSIEMGDQGKVFVEFIVNTDGSLEQFKVVKPVSKELDREAKRVIKAMPNWTPYEFINGEKVRVRCTVPINFVIR